MKFKLSSLLYQLISAVIIIYIIIAFLLWFPTPIEMCQGSVGAPAGAILGVFMFPFAGLLYLAVVGTVIFLAVKLYEFLYDASNNLNMQSNYLRIKSIAPFFMILTLLLFFFTDSSETIVLKGRINSLKSYAVTVKYQATNNVFFCNEWSMWRGSRKRSKYYTYYPKLEKNEHHVKIPTDKTFFSWCNYKVKNIEIDIQHEKSILFEKRTAMVYLKAHNKQITFIEAKNNTYTLDIGKINHTRNIIKTSKTAKVYRESSKQIEQKRLVKIARNQLNKLSSFFNEFANESARFPTQEEAKQIFSKHQTLTIDPWGNHYIYEIGKDHQRARLKTIVPALISNQKTKYKLAGSLLHVPIVLHFEGKEKMIKNMGAFQPLFYGFYYKNKRYPSIEEAKKLLRREGNLSSYFNSPHITKKQNRQLLERCIKRIEKVKQIDKIPIDTWGNPYQYGTDTRVPIPYLFSLGLDGIKSDDDILYADMF